MMTAENTLSADQWFERWQQLADHRERAAEEMQQKAAKALSSDIWIEEGRRLHDEWDAARREKDIASARQDVAWAHYVVARHNLYPNDVFDVRP